MLFAIWLSPAQPSFLSLQKKIIHFAKLYDAPAYMPHMTIFVGNSDSLESVHEVFSNTVKNVQSLEATAIGVEHSDYYFKTLFIQFSNNDSLLTLNKQLQTLDNTSNYIFNPHISLLYKNLPQQTKQQLVDEIWPTIDPKMMALDKIQLLSVTNDETKEAVEKWKVIESHTLIR